MHGCHCRHHPRTPPHHQLHQPLHLHLCHSPVHASNAIHLSSNHIISSGSLPHHLPTTSPACPITCQPPHLPCTTLHTSSAQTTQHYIHPATSRASHSPYKARLHACHCSSHHQLQCSTLHCCPAISHLAAGTSALLHCATPAAHLHPAFLLLIHALPVASNQSPTACALSTQVRLIHSLRTHAYTLHAHASPSAMRCRLIIIHLIPCQETLVTLHSLACNATSA